MGSFTKHIGRKAKYTFKRVANSGGLLENFLLHVVAVGAKIDGAGISMNRLRCALDRLIGSVSNACASQRDIDHIPFF